MNLGPDRSTSRRCDVLRGAGKEEFLQQAYDLNFNWEAMVSLRCGAHLCLCSAAWRTPTANERPKCDARIRSETSGIQRSMALSNWSCDRRRTPRHRRQHFTFDRRLCKVHNRPYGGQPQAHPVPTLLRPCASCPRSRSFIVGDATALQQPTYLRPATRVHQLRAGGDHQHGERVHR